MAGLFVLLFYLCAGVICVRGILFDRSPLIRWWVGLGTGVLLFMWLPALFAFFLRFTLAAEFSAMAAALILSLVSLFFQRKSSKAFRGLDEKDQKTLRALLLFALPLTLLSFYLQYTHTIRPAENGSLHVGQSTYGDLCMHMSIATSLRFSSLPADYNILPGSLLGYPFLTDATATSLLLFGMPLNWAMVIPGTLMSFLVYAGYILLAREMCKGRLGCALLAAALLFFNGGLGFLYDFDLSGSDFSKIREIFTGYYTTPANQPEYNLRWSNLIADLLLPQRTFLGGWCILLPSLYLAREAFLKKETRFFLLAGLAGGALPLIHTHSFLGLGLYSGGCLIYSLLHEKENRSQLLKGAGLYMGLALALALPQLFGFTLRQATDGGFLTLHFNWVNQSGGNFVDFYPWFWVKNVGLPLIAILCVLFDAKREQAMDLLGAFMIFIVAELILFQPLDYDNNKLFYIWYLLALPAASTWLGTLYQKMRGLRSRCALACLFIAASVLSGSLSIVREAISDYELFSYQDAELAQYIEENTDPEDTFMTGLHHNNPVYALAGRDVVCGPSLFLHWHGLDYTGRANDVRMFYADPEENSDLLKIYDVDYIVVGPWERADLTVDEDALDETYELVFQSGSSKLYRVN